MQYRHQKHPRHFTRWTTQRWVAAYFDPLEARILMSISSGTATPSLNESPLMATVITTPAADQPSLVSGGRAVATARQFGAKGDGQTDDSAALQAAIDSLAPFGIFFIENGTYRLNKGLVVHRPITIYGNNSTLLLNSSAWPENRGITLQSQLSGTSYAWNQDVKAGQSKFKVAIPTNELKAGDSVFIELGSDPNDPGEQHYTTIATVLSNDGNFITIDRSVPYDINPGLLNNKITKVTSLVNYASIRDLNFDFVDGVISDIQISVEMSQNISIQNITGRFTILANVSDSQNVQISDVSGRVEVTHGAAGRVLTVWQSDNVTLQNASITTKADAPVVFLESWARGTIVDGLTVNWENSLRSNSAVLFATGGSYDTYFDNIRIYNQGEINLIGSGIQSASYRFGSVYISGPIRSTPLQNIQSLQVGSDVFDADAIVSQEFVIPLSSNLADHQVGLFNGTIRSATIIGDWPAGLDTILITHNGGGIKFTHSAPKTVDLLLGTDYPINSLAEFAKRISTYTSNVNPEEKLRLLINYWPAPQQ